MPKELLIPLVYSLAGAITIIVPVSIGYWLAGSTGAVNTAIIMVTVDVIAVALLAMKNKDHFFD